MSLILIAGSNWEFAQRVARLVARFNDRVKWVDSREAASRALEQSDPKLLLLQASAAGEDTAAWITPFKEKGVPCLLVGPRAGLEYMRAQHAAGIDYYVTLPYHPRELLSLIHTFTQGHKRVVCLGGGTGLHTLLMGLKQLPQAHLTAVVGMSDDGGSSGRIRQAFGILPPGDIRRSLVALSTAPDLMKRLIQYRFKAGEGLRDHNLGNLLLTAMVDLTGSEAEAVRAMGDILTIDGIVLPVSTRPATLVAEMENGMVVRGENAIDVPRDRDPKLRIRRAFHQQPTQANPEALAAILAADVITLGPGDLYTSLIATLLVDGVPEAVRASGARRIAVANIMTKPGETYGFDALAHARELVQYLGGDCLDDVVLSNTPLAEAALQQYAKQEQFPVSANTAAEFAGVTKARIHRMDIGMREELARHDPPRLRDAFAELLGLALENGGELEA